MSELQSRRGVGSAMIKHLFIGAALAPFALAAQVPATAARPVPTSLPIDRVVAVVGTQPVLWTDVLTAVNQRRSQGLQLPTDSAAQAVLARSVLSELVDEEILVQKAKEMKLGWSTLMFQLPRRQIQTCAPSSSRRGVSTTAQRRLAQRRVRKSLTSSTGQQAAGRHCRLRKRANVNVTRKKSGGVRKKPRRSQNRRRRDLPTDSRRPMASPSEARAKARADSLLVEIRRAVIRAGAKRESMDPARRAWRRFGWNDAAGDSSRIRGNDLRDARGIEHGLRDCFGYHSSRDRGAVGGGKASNHARAGDDSEDVARAASSDTFAAQWSHGVSYDSRSQASRATRRKASPAIPEGLSTRVVPDRADGDKANDSRPVRCNPWCAKIRVIRSSRQQAGE